MVFGARLDAIATQFPQLRPVTANYLGEGCDSEALLINDRWVFRFPKTAEVEAQLAIESALLPAIGDRLPVAVPRFFFHGQPGEHFPRRFVGYAKLAGVPAIGLDPVTIAAADVTRLGLFLAALHGTPVETARACGVPVEDLRASLHALRAEALQSLTEIARVAPDAPLELWRSMLDRPPDVRSDEALVLAHNDLAAEHILVDPAVGRITGVIDWSDAALTRAEVDFAGFFHWGGERLAAAVLRVYELSRPRLPGHALDVARYLGACRGALDVTFGTDSRRPEYVAAGLRALRLCVEGAG